MKAGVSWLHRRYGCHIRIRHGNFLHNTRQSNLHPLFYYGRFRQLVGKVNKGNGQPAFLFCQSVQQFMFVYTVSLAYLTLYAVALHRTFEAALRNTDKNGSIRLQLPLPANTPRATGRPRTNANRPQTSSLLSFFYPVFRLYVRYSP